MCSLLGVAGTLGKADLDAFTDLMMVGQLRGIHGTGVAVVGRNNEGTSVAKRPWSAPDFLTSRVFDEATSGSGKVLMGHNRHATMGSHTMENTHPFEFSDIVGAHNGTLTNKYELEDSRLYGTDSEAALALINEKGGQSAIPELKGAWAFTWYDQQENALYMIRNDKRTLHIAYGDKRRTLWWASEASFLDFILKRSNIDYDGKTYYLEKDKLYKYQLPKEKRQFRKPRTWDCEGGEEDVGFTRGRGTGYFVNGVWTSTANHHHHNDPYLNGGQSDDETNPTKKSVIDAPYQELVEKRMTGLKNGTSVSSGESADIIHLPGKFDMEIAGDGHTVLKTRKEDIDLDKMCPKDGVYTDYHGRDVDQVMFKFLISDGCDFCGGDMEWGEPTLFLNDLSVLCQHCFTDEDQMIELGLQHTV